MRSEGISTGRREIFKSTQPHIHAQTLQKSHTE